MTDTSTRLKNHYRQKGISFTENSNIKESHLGKKKLHLNKAGKVFFAKCLINYIKNLERTDSYDDLVALGKCISNTLNDTESNARSQLDNLHRDNLNKIIFAHLNIKSIRNKFDQPTDLIKGKIDILMVSKSKNGLFSS